MLRKNPEVFDFARLSPAMTVAEAERALGVGMRGGLRYGVIIAEAGQPLTCITWQHLEGRPQNATLATLRSEWPALWTLPERDAHDLTAVAFFYEAVLQDDDNLAGIVLTDAAGLPRAILPKGVLFEALAAAPTRARLAAKPGRCQRGD